MESDKDRISRLNLRISELHSKNAGLRIENEALKRRNPMISEENERLAEMAYKRFRADHDKTLPEWVAFGPKHIWRDLVQTFHSNPRSHISIANPMEACVSAVLTEKAEGGIPAAAVVKHPEPVAEPEKIKPAKAFRK